MKRTIALVGFLIAAITCNAQRIKQMEFRNQPIPDILLALAESAAVSILPDETVSGMASFYFAEAEFDDAFARFLVANKLFATREGKTYYVSRISTRFDTGKNLVSIEADEVDLQYLIRALSKAIGKTVLYDPLPRAPMTVNIASLPPGEALEILLKRFPDYQVQKESAFFYVKKLLPASKDPSIPASIKKAVVSRRGDEYALNLEKGKFIETLTELFALAGREYSLLTRVDLALSDLYFSPRSFDQLLRLILEQGNTDFVVHDGIYYIFEIQKKDVLKKLRPTTTLQLKYVSSQDLLSVLPADMASGGIVKTDKATNSLIITGSPEEVGPVVELIAQMDKPLEGRSYCRFDAKYMKVKDLVAIIPTRLLPASHIVLPESNAFIALLSEENVEPLESFIKMVDRKNAGIPVTLRYIKSDELMKNLPPSVSKEDVVESGFPSIVFFVGSEDKRELFFREKEIVDRPKPQIRYELLVVQYQRGSGLSWTRTFKAADAATGDKTGFTANMSSLLSLNFDVVSQFGYLFSLQLSAELSESLAQIFADTTLTGISGQEVKFQNTNTYRYAEAVYDTNTGKYTYTGTTREITSGLILAINGWVSGDGMITMTVNTTISKQGANSASDVSKLPPTSEKIVSTQIRTASGRPVVIGGLLQRDKDISIKKVPILGDIPLLGLLFRNKTETVEETELVVYIVPHVTFGDEQAGRSAGRRMEEYYDSFVREYRR